MAIPDKPITRKELYMAALNGVDVPLPEPLTREEQYLYELAKNGVGGTTDYNELINKPKIGDVELSKNTTLSDIGAQPVLTFDNTPTENSINPVKSSGLYTALSGKVDTSSVGSANGVASLGESGKVPASQLPSYVDDVVNGYLYNGAFYEDSEHTISITGEDGKIYVDLSTNKTYRWSGTAFVEISESLALGETSSTAYAGDKGKANSDAITALQTGKQDALTAGNNIQINNNTISATDTTYNNATTSATGLMSAADKQKLDGVAAGANNYVHPSYTARTGKPTANAAPGFGGSVTVSQITSDAYGHVTGATDRTITIPSATATQSSAGLMSAADKTKLDNVDKYTNVKSLVTFASGVSDFLNRSTFVKINNIVIANVQVTMSATAGTAKNILTFQSGITPKNGIMGTAIIENVNTGGVLGSANLNNIANANTLVATTSTNMSADGHGLHFQLVWVTQ